MSSKQRPSTRPARYAPRVQVWAHGSYLYRVHAERADYLVSAGAAVITAEDRYAKRVWRVHLTLIAAAAAQRKGAPKPSHPRHFATAAPVFLEVVGYSAEKRLATYTFHKITKADHKRIAAERQELLRRKI